MTENNGKIYRLYYLNYHQIGEEYGHHGHGCINWPLKTFILPDKMSESDGFKVLSYLITFIENSLGLEECSLRGLEILDDVLDFPRFGFGRPVNKVDDEDIINLYTITGRMNLFKRSSHYKKYFEWYQENVTKKEVEEIYSKCGMEFKDLVPLQKKTESSKEKKKLKRRKNNKSIEK